MDTKKLRRVVTGQSELGSTVVAVDEVVEPTASSAGSLFWLLWGTDEIPVALPTDGQPNFLRTRFPLPNGARVSVVEYAAKDSQFRRTEMPTRATIPGDAGRTVTRDSKTGMHMTDTVDIAIILEGEIGLEQSDGEEVTLHAGDVLIQNGGIHAWRPRDQSCRVAFVILGAERHQRSTPTPGQTERHD